MKNLFSLYGFILSVLLALSSLQSANAQVSNVVAQPGANILSSADDFINFSLNPASPTTLYVYPYSYTVTATQNGTPINITLQDGTTAATAVGYYTTPQPLRTAT